MCQFSCKLVDKLYDKNVMCIQFVRELKMVLLNYFNNISQHQYANQCAIITNS